MKFSISKKIKSRKIIGLIILVLLIFCGLLAYGDHTNKYQQIRCVEKGTKLFNETGQYSGVSLPAQDNSSEGPIRDFCKTIYPDNYWLTLASQPSVYPYMLEQ